MIGAKTVMSAGTFSSAFHSGVSSAATASPITHVPRPIERAASIRFSAASQQSAATNGLNGVLLAAAAEQGLPGVGLLGEVHAMARDLPYPALRDTGPEPVEEDAALPPAREPVEESSADMRRIEELFAQAEKDRSRAFELKTELDRLGVFRQYEDKFLGLFKEKG
jgi:hypothetical protein